MQCRHALLSTIDQIATYYLRGNRPWHAAGENVAADVNQVIGDEFVSFCQAAYETLSFTTHLSQELRQLYAFSILQPKKKNIP